MSLRVGSPNAEVIAVTAEANSVGLSGGSSFGMPVSLGPMSVTEAEVIDALRPVEDPELHRSIVDLGMVKRVDLASGSVGVLIALTVPGCPLRAEIDRRVTEAIKGLDPQGAVSVEFTVMTPEEPHALRTGLHGDPASTAGTHAGHGHAEGRAIPFAEAGSRTRVLLIASGKGGVGKSSVTTNLAVALAQRGRSVGVLDADVWGFSIPKMLGVDRNPVVLDEMLLPPEANGVRCISIGFFADEDQPVIWRGPMLHKELGQFLTAVYWDGPDFLLVELPPGTGDVSISLAQMLPRAEMYVVTTPQPAAQRVAQRAGFMAHKVNLEVRGVIENMAWFTGDDGKRYELFGRGGGSQLAEALEVPLIGQVPLVLAMREGGDDGHPIVVIEPNGEAPVVFESIAERIDTELAPTRRTHRELK